MSFQICPDIDEDIKALFRRLNRKKIVAPRPDQHVDRCHFSKTGWAVWNNDGGCTCEPAKAPAKN